MKVEIILTGCGGELDRHVIELNGEDDSAEQSAMIFESIGEWVLAPGDTIRINEVTP